MNGVREAPAGADHGAAAHEYQLRYYIRADFEKIAREIAPCDVGIPDVDIEVPDDRVKLAMDLCVEMSEKHG